jgi:hypothetical protein
MKISTLNMSRSFLALAAAWAVSSVSSHAQILAATNFTSLTQGTGLDPAGWNDTQTYGHLNFGSTGGVTTGGYYTTSRDFNSSIGLSSSSTWVAVQMSLTSGTSPTFSFGLALTGDSSQFIELGSPSGLPATPAGTVPWNYIRNNGGTYAGVYGSSSGVTAPTGTTTYLLDITSTTPGTITVEGWTYDSALVPTSDPTGAKGTAFNYGTFSFTSTGTGLDSVLLGGQNLVGDYQNLIVAGSYADISSSLDGTPSVPEPSTFGLLAAGAIGLVGFAARRRLLCLL